MKKVNKHMLKAVERVARNAVTADPPICSGLLHQPKRPVAEKKK